LPRDKSRTTGDSVAANILLVFSIKNNMPIAITRTIKYGTPSQKVILSTLMDIYSEGWKNQASQERLILKLICL